MLIRPRSLALYIGQDYDAWKPIVQARAAEHILSAGDEVRGALAMLYEIPAYTRDELGAITAPAGVVGDPERTALGPIVKMLAAAFILDPAKGIQPQEERSTAETYRISARAQLKQLANKTAFIASLATLEGLQIVPSADVISAMNAGQRVATAGVRQRQSGIYGQLKDPDLGSVIE